MSIKSINPYNGKEIAVHTKTSDDELNQILNKSKTAFESWRNVPISDRCKLLLNVADLLKNNVEKYAETMTLEMGKPISEAKGEIKKCAWVCEYYAENAEVFLADELIETDASESFISYEPLGTILAIMPWNFPFWQVFRFAAPTVTAGNTGLLKHASNVYGCATHIENIFKEAGYPDGVFQKLIIDHDQTETVIKHDSVKAVTLTGSVGAGKIVGSLAGKNLKKSVLELGGSNAFVVMEDADMDQAIDTGVNARMMNSGQSCIAAKRFILIGDAYDKFLPGYLEKVKAIKKGDPMDEDTEIGPLARKDLADELHRQMKASVDQGAKLEMGGVQDNAFYEPTVLTNVKPGMPAFDEETFGPLAAIIRAKDNDEAFELASMTEFGLGITVFTGDKERARRYINKAPDGAFFINDLVKSDPRLPFGGTKNSGYGRELSREGMREFVNKKTVYIK